MNFKQKFHIIHYAFAMKKTENQNRAIMIKGD